MTVIVLIIIGTLLIVLNINAIRKDKKSFKAVLNNEEDDIREYEIEIGKIRREFSETVLELQKEIQNLKDKNESVNDNSEKVSIGIEKSSKNDTWGNEELVELIHKSANITQTEETDDLYTIKVNNRIKESSSQYEEKSEDKNLHNELNKSGIIDENNSEKHNTARVNEIRELLGAGYNVEEIAEKIGVGKGEVLLIKELYIK